ncbi:hypothetical protein FALBO_779 [Fusarium albosuccineum]|uniref:Uncharacterized protein n=1 Tax=Fusarium albosuccineum TaxID=1237068 RepID=A0A8H4LQ34_9HYPO|nr:hypothetical protein FALBO_779 [Fusarium albosuccineum]
MPIWTDSLGKTILNGDAFLDAMENHWLKWASKKLCSEDKQAWKNTVEYIYNHNPNYAKFSDLDPPTTWAHVTAYKVLFSDDFFRSKRGAVAQIKFPEADLAKWEPNSSGPTTNLAFKSNKFIKQKGLGEEFRRATALAKRPWSCESAPDEPPAKKPCPKVTGLVEVAVTEPSSLTSSTRPLLCHPEDVSKVFNNVEKQLASVRQAAETNTKVHQQGIDDLRAKHRAELQEVWKYTHQTIASIRETHKKELEAVNQAHKEEIETVRKTYEGVISTLDKACLDGMTTLRNARQEVYETTKRSST